MSTAEQNESLLVAELSPTDSLPEGWTITVADDAGQWQTGGTPSRKVAEYFNGSVPWVKSGDLKDGIIRTTQEKITKAGLQNSAAKLLPVGTVSIALYGATIGKLGILGIQAATNQACASCIVDSALIDGQYLFFYLLHQRQALIHAGQGGAQPNLTNQIVRDWPLLLAPLAEQKRIVARVEELLAQVNAARARLAKVAQILKRFRQAVLTAACSGRLTEDWHKRHECADWEGVTLSDVIEDKPKNGYSAKPVKHKTKWKILTLTATTSGRFNGQHFKYFDEPIPKDSPFWLQPGDILVQRGNTIEYVGVPAIYDGPPGEFIYPDLMIRFRANSRIDTKFLYFALSWEETRTYLRDRAIGTAGSMPKINQTTLVETPIKLAPSDEQHEMARRVEALFKLADTIEKRVGVATKRADKLTQAILAKAFRGELVPTEAELARRECRDYESASTLLDRVRSGQQAATGPAAQRRSRRLC